MQRDELASGEDGLAMRARAGIGFSVSDWLRAGAVEDRAEAECAAYRAELETRAQAASLEALAVDGYAVKARQLEVALTRGQALVEESKAQLALNARTISEHLRTLQAYQALRREFSAARSQLASLSGLTPPVAPKPEAGRMLASSVAAFEHAAGKLRRSQALDLTVEAGYDEIVGIHQELPVYAELGLRFRPGYFWQHGADEESATARASAALSAFHAQQRDYERALERGRREHAVLVDEADELRAYLLTLDAQRQALLGTGNRDAAVMAEQLWFEAELGRAELVRLDTTVRAIERWSGNRIPAASTGVPTPRRSSVAERRPSSRVPVDASPPSAAVDRASMKPGPGDPGLLR